MSEEVARTSAAWLACGPEYDVLYDTDLAAYVFIAGNVAVRIHDDLDLFRVYAFEPFRAKLLERSTVEAD